MSKYTSSSSSSGIGFVGLLTIVFIVLKLTGIVNWSWWWVLSPLWICWSIIAVIVIVVAIPYLSIKIQKRRLLAALKKRSKV